MNVFLESALDMFGWITPVIELGIVQQSSLQKQDPEKGGEAQNIDKGQRRGGTKKNPHILNKAKVQKYINNWIQRFSVK